jgi:hypothetical protein
LKLRKACGLDGIPNKFLGHLPRKPLYIWHIYLITAFLFPFFQSLGRKQKPQGYWNLVRIPNSLKIYVRLASSLQ